LLDWPENWLTLQMNSKEFAYIASDPARLFTSIPKDVQANIKWRQDIHSFLAENPTAQELFLYNCASNPAILFNGCFFTYNPKKTDKCRNVPFILRPAQEVAIATLKRAIDEGFDVAIDKSREEGASELLCKLFLVYWLLTPDTYMLIGSRKEELVDQSTDIKNGRVIGPHQTLFHKILYALANLPVWWTVQFSKRHRFLQNLENGSMLEGEATNESFGAGNRATAVLIDEVARIEPEPAQYIIDNIHDTTDCCIFNSTHFKWGAGHPYAKLLRSNKIEIITLGFEDNPTKNYGMYRSPKQGYIEIKDIEYYRQKNPEIFTTINAGEIIDVTTLGVSNVKGLRFVTDGGESNFGRWRSVWFDNEVLDRARSLADIAQNILRVPQGSADMFFDNAMIERIRTRFVDKPTHRGEVAYQFDREGHIVNEAWREKSKGKLKWWGELTKDRPRKDHAYIVSCDVSFGKGASNSVIAICDVNTCEIVGLMADPYASISDFADTAIAISKWANNALLIWESNGPGNEFDHRVRFQRYPRVYIPKPERARIRSAQNKRGWQSTPGLNGSKIDMLNRLDSALMESLREDRTSTYIILHDEDTTRELDDYIFDVHKIDVNPSNSATDSSGAKYAHGDRVIAVGMAVIAMERHPKMRLVVDEAPPTESFEHRFRDWKLVKTKEKLVANKRQFLY
jgi:hypothetical protein